jgi:predicted choloylglycine hydrolase
MQRWLTENKDLKRKDYYGQYVVNRNFFKGRQADWQYNTFRFEIRNNDSIYFFVTDREDILETYRGSVTTTKSCRSERLIINMEQPTHHILSGNPTTYRSTWSFYLVFHSPKFNNVFFKKGTWKALEE